ncbi:unnamed protein product [Cylindrotheca closterium]|uniref:Uncharacterized protein n=1 Tax=Cylindrotheca closterium TaxID=2856 RepID=A0AAD2FT76_9STRA|nr:unnamed protein product [Cylindrotheca closterium]
MDPWWMDDVPEGFNGSGDGDEDLLIRFLTSPVDGTSVVEERILQNHTTLADTAVFALPANYVDLHIVGRNEKDTGCLSQLKSFLMRDPRKWRHVMIEWDGRVPLPSTTPGFLDVLSQLMRNSEKLDIIGSLGDEAAYRTLMSGLMALDGTRQLLLHDIGSLRDERIAKLLAHGLAHSQTLESFRFESIETKQVVGAALIEGLSINGSLISLELETIGYEDDKFLTDLINTVQQHPKIRSLSLESHEIQQNIMDKMGDYLREEACQLNELKIVYRGGRLPPLPQLGGTKTQNSSLHRLDLVRTMIPSQYLDSLCSTFTGLSVLALPFNTIRDLSPLMVGLCHFAPTLQVLDLRHNHIDHDGLKQFATKLPHMRSLRRLCLTGNPFLDGSPATAISLEILTENAMKSRSLECLVLSPEHNVSFAARHAMNINRGGRRGLSSESPNLPTIELWPKILHRSLTIKYYDVSDDIETPRNESQRSDVVFYLLCHHPTIFDSNK